MVRSFKIIPELHRRGVFRVAGLYIVAAWVGVQVASLVFPAIDIAEAAIRFVWAGFMLGFPVALIFAWRYDITPQGIVRTPASEQGSPQETALRPPDYLVLGILLAVIAVITYQSGDEISRYDAESLQAGDSAVLDRYTIAVLPLDMLSGEPEQQYLADGMQDALISMLSRISALTVISRTSARIAGTSDKLPGEIGEELGAAHLIEGSVAYLDNRVRVSVRLIDAGTGQLAWTRMYERPVHGMLQLQSELARAIAGEVQVLLTAEESAYLASPRQLVPAAYENYLKGRFHWYRFGENDLALARRYFQAAIELDPDYALAYVGLADALATPAHTGLSPALHAFPQAGALVAKALELDPLLAEAHDLQARINFVWDFDWLAADRGFREAIRLNPSHPDARVVYSQFLGVQGRWEESLQQVQEALALDPLNNWFRIELGARLSWVERHAEALAVYQTIADEQPNWFMVYRHLWEVYFHLGDLDQALLSAQQYFILSGDNELAEILEKHGETPGFSSAMLQIAQAMAQRHSTTYVSEFEIARLFAFAGNEQSTLEWLQRAAQVHDSQLIYATADPLFSLVWDHPDFAALRRNMNLP